MNTKLTLTVQSEVIKAAKSYAREKGQSLSELVENYFKLLTMDNVENDPISVKSIFHEYRGIVNIQDGEDYKSILEQELTKKYDS